jgi:hypothetical protein
MFRFLPSLSIYRALFWRDFILELPHALCRLSSADK